VRQDALGGLVSREAAAEEYGVVLDEDFNIDWEGTLERRGGSSKSKVQSRKS
jgi:hypothetical protein